MDLMVKIKSELKKTEKATIVKALGYSNIERGIIKLDEFLSVKSIEEWMMQSGYDFVHYNRSFLIKLCEILELPDKECMAHIEKAEIKLRSIEKMDQPYIFVNTNFKRTTEPIFVLAFTEGLRRIAIDKFKIYDRDDEGLSLAKEIIKEHYKKTQGEVAIWGKIENYVYHVKGKKYLINPDGEIEKDGTDVYESMATLSIK